MGNLKPCPFCGGEPLLQFFSEDLVDDPYYHIACHHHNCPSIGLFGRLEITAITKEELVAKWNTRHVETVDNACSCNTLNYGYGYAKCFDCGKLKIISDETGHTI